MLPLIIDALVFSHVRYCAQVYASANRTTILRLQKVFKFAARVISGRRKFDHISDVLLQLDWLNVEQLHLFSLRIGIFSTERGMGQFISAAAFKLQQSFSTSTDFIRIGSRVFIFDRRQWISAEAFNFGMDIQ